MPPVVDDRRCPLAGAGLGEINPETLAAANDEVCTNPLAAKAPNDRIANRARRKTRYVAAVEAKVGETHRNVRLASSECRGQSGRLKEPLDPRRAEPQHDLAEGDHLCHSAAWRHAASGVHGGQDLLRLHRDRLEVTGRDCSRIDQR